MWISSWTRCRRRRDLLSTNSASLENGRAASMLVPVDWYVRQQTTEGNVTPAILNQVPGIGLLWHDRSM